MAPNVPLCGCYGCHGMMVVVRRVLARLWAGREAQKRHLEGPGYDREPWQKVGG